MEYMEQKAQEQIEAGEAYMEHLCDVMEKFSKLCKENSIHVYEVEKAIHLFKEMGWEFK